MVFLLISHDPEITIQELMDIIPGPDFPTGAMILGRSGIRKAYETGRGSIKVRAKAEIDSRNQMEKKLLLFMKFLTK